MIFNASRAIVRRLALSRPSSSTDRVAQLSYHPLRVISSSYSGLISSSEQGWTFNGSVLGIGRRSFATKPASRPKAHTGRTASKPRKKAATTAKPAAAKSGAATTKKPAAGLQPKAIPKTKATASAGAKPKAKKPGVKAKTKPKVRARKPLTDAQRAKAAATKERQKARAAAAKERQKSKAAAVKERQKARAAATKERQKAKTATAHDRLEIKKLKEEALTTPKKLPATAYQVVCSEVAKANHAIGGKAAADKYKSLSPEELEVANPFTRAGHR